MANLSHFGLLVLALCGMPAQLAVAHETLSKLILEQDHQPLSRIIGGMDAKRGEFKFYVAYSRFGTNSVPFCGATLIDKQWALTAAHCHGSGQPDAFQARVSAYELSKDSPTTEEIRQLSRVITHPEYKGGPNQYGYDYGLLAWQEPIPDTVTPVVLFNADTYEGNPVQQLTAIGLGVSDQADGTNTRPDVLQQADLDFVSIDVCRETYGSLLEPTVMLCAGQVGVGGCFGDSGGPVFFTEQQTGTDKQIDKQIGVASFVSSFTCALAPTVWAKLNEEIIKFVESFTQSSI